MMIRTLSTACLAALVLSACTIVTNPASTADGGATNPDGGTDPGTTTDGGVTTGGDGSVTTGPVVTGSCAYGEPNETREASKAIELNTTYTGLCIANADDKDFFSFTTPADSTGGYVQLHASNVGAQGRIQIDVFSGASNETILSHYGDSDGSTLNVWFSAKPGASYRVEMQRFTGDSMTYDLGLTYTKINDTYEPNDTRQTAKPITKGTAVNAFMYAGRNATAVPEAEYDDWYSVDLAAGTATINVANVPSDLRVTTSIVTTAGVELASNYSPNDGADALVTTPIAVAGTYYVKVGIFTGAEVEGQGANIPPQLTTPYKLLVTQ